MEDLREHLRGWLVGLSVLALAVFALWVTGALEPTDVHLGRPMAAGDVLEGRRWSLAIRSAHVQADYDDSPELVVEVEGMFTGDSAESSPAQGVVVVKTPTGYAFEDFRWMGGSGFGQPGVQSRATVAIPQPEWEGTDMPITVAVFDEREVHSFIQDERWDPAAPIGHVPLNAVDIR